MAINQNSTIRQTPEGQLIKLVTFQVLRPPIKERHLVTQVLQRDIDLNKDLKRICHPFQKKDSLETKALNTMIPQKSQNKIKGKIHMTIANTERAKNEKIAEEW